MAVTDGSAAEAGITSTARVAEGQEQSKRKERPAMHGIVITPAETLILVGIVIGMIIMAKVR